MAEATRSSQAVKEMEERISARMDSHFMELAASLQQTLTLSLKETMQEWIYQKIEDDNSSRVIRSQSPAYVCGTRLARIDFPRFNGESVNQWIYQCENYFLIDNTPDEFKVKLAIVYLEGKTLQWHTALGKSCSNSSLPSWQEYKKQLIDRFGDICDDPMAELMRLRQKRSVGEYHEEFDAIITGLNLTQEYILSCFLGGLKKDIQMMVRMFPPDSLQRAFALARMYEAASIGNNPNKFQRGVLGPAPSPPMEKVPLNIPLKPKQKKFNISLHGRAKS